MPSDYLKRFYAGETLALSRIMSRVERGGGEAERLLRELFPRVGDAYRVAVTGLTGSGKSTLLSTLIERERAGGRTVGVIAEDPSSPFSGGAILGDRVRMLDAAGDDGVFIRSIASRGSETGFSTVATELADVLDAFGRDTIFLETIGVGQLEYRIRNSADTTVVVLTPEAGDELQGLKSGLMEVGDIFVVNKADRPDAARFADAMLSMLELRRGSRDWEPRVVQTQAIDGAGIDELVALIADHRSHMAAEGRLAAHRTAAMVQRARRLVEERLRRLIWAKPYIGNRFDDVTARMANGGLSPYEAAAEIVDAIEFREREDNG